MFIRLFLLFTIIPLVELAILMKLGSMFGVFHTIAVVILTGIIGAYLARDQGLRVINEIQTTLAKGRVPADPLIEGALILVASAFLLTPGVLTDICGFALVMPLSRKVIRDFLKAYFAEKIAKGFYSAGQSGGSWFYSKTYSGDLRKEKRIGKDDDDVIDV